MPDPATPIAGTLGALQELVAQGKVREIGCSNFSAQQLRDAEEAAGTGAHFVSVQNHYNMFRREDEGIAPGGKDRHGVPAILSTC